jgi:hypothetical protein
MRWTSKRYSKEVSYFIIYICTYSLNDAELTKKMFEKIQKSVEVMVKMFKQSKFFLCVA